MPVGLEVYDAQGRKILGADKSVLRIVKVLHNINEVQKFKEENPNENGRFFIFTSAFVDLDKYPNELLITDRPEVVMTQLDKFSELFLVGEMNVPSER